jgi:hypothetical protein
MKYTSVAIYDETNFQKFLGYEIVLSECYPFNALFVFETTVEFCVAGPVWTEGENISRLPERIILWN